MCTRLCSSLINMKKLFLKRMKMTVLSCQTLYNWINVNKEYWNSLIQLKLFIHELTRICVVRFVEQKNPAQGKKYNIVLWFLLNCGKLMLFKFDHFIFFSSEVAWLFWLHWQHSCAPFMRWESCELMIYQVNINFYKSQSIRKQMWHMLIDFSLVAFKISTG